jgi:hypothetical protein
MNDLIRNVLGGIAGGPRDPYFNYTTLLLPGTGTNGAQNGRSGPAAGYRDGTFLDSSSNNFTITRNGNTTQGTFSPFSQTGWSNYFVSSYLQTPTGALPESTQNYTVEFWFYLNSWPGSFTYFISGTVNNSWSLYYNSSTQAIMLSYYGVVAVLSASKDHANLGAWNHLAIVRSSNNCAMWINGTRRATATDSNSFVASVARIGEGFSGIYISNARILRGTAIYDYTQTQISVPTAPLTAITNTSLLTCQSNRFVDNSTNNFAFTVSGTPSVQAFSPFAPTATYSPAVHGGSGYFDGTGDSLQIPNNTFNVSSSDITIELWAYFLSLSGEREILEFGTGGTGDLQLLTLNNNFQFGGSGQAKNNFAAVTNQWYHLAAVKIGNTYYLYVNGIRNTAQSSGSASASTVINIGSRNNSSNYLSGYISNFRISNFARYTTSTIAVPTSPVSVDANTVVLLNFTNAAITDATAKNVLETVGNAQISTAQSKWGGGSMYFATGQTYGSGDNLVVPFSPVYSLDTRDFTVEGWFYFTNLNIDQRGIVALGDGANGFPDVYNAWSLVYLGTEAGGNNQIRWYRYDGTNYMYNTSGLTLVANTWTHIAVSRGSGVLKIFVGGVSYYSQANSQSFAAVNTNPLRVGLQYYGQASSYVPGYGGPRYWPGYISDLRITKGYARYTANFTPPTTPFALR